jgi:hypothetical protein
MNRKDLITELKLYFSSDELVCPDTFGKFGESSWQFFRTELLETLLIVRRDIIGFPMIINNWLKKGQFSQRALRCDLCQLVKDKSTAGQIYLSAHILGAAVDFDASGMTADEVRQTISNHRDLLPYPIRLEQNVTWTHIDVLDGLNGQKITYFTS